jgi:hypothetical protein
MAHVKVCDRCGKKIERGMYPISITPYRYVLTTETDLSETSYDLCKNCRKDLKKFLEGPSNGETEVVEE